MAEFGGLRLGPPAAVVVLHPDRDLVVEARHYTELSAVLGEPVSPLGRYADGDGELVITVGGAVRRVHGSASRPFAETVEDAVVAFVLGEDPRA